MFNTKMKALRILENEHLLIRHLMQEWFTELYAASQMDAEMPLRLQMKKIKDLMVDFMPVLDKHQQKEEKFFFPILGAYVGTNQGPVVTIEAEHDEMNQYFTHFMTHPSVDMSVEQMKLILKDLNEGYEILMVHMYKEESVLFPMAEKVFKIKDEDILLEAVNTKIYG
ncbi:hemerythrin domain-containing protein [Macrococcus hajekii]|uniref:Hemerythrin domain-containing protein n=1 Tax=Macrococcus hajekii TaxID=198482 RepID=A0A4R6BK12_9STAP|nr:hemerythrin domain-containing protein [Macrococcus hajekii]TDM01901.1 hemerythrin domain-containing protein [Macrococcus hajekii]GGB08403.1 hypothetical protein GCM10007190_15500 [Macrococcus hajekii]